jgi:hypothetical protein
MELQITMLSKISQMQKDKVSRVFSHTQNLKRKEHDRRRRSYQEIGGDQ